MQRSWRSTKTELLILNMMVITSSGRFHRCGSDHCLQLAVLRVPHQEHCLARKRQRRREGTGIDTGAREKRVAKAANAAITGTEDGEARVKVRAPEPKKAMRPVRAATHRRMTTLVQLQLLKARDRKVDTGDGIGAATKTRMMTRRRQKVRMLTRVKRRSGKNAVGAAREVVGTRAMETVMELLMTNLSGATRHPKGCCGNFLGWT